MEPAALVDLDRYPVIELTGRGGPVADHHAVELRPNGVSILPGFIRPAAPALGRRGLPAAADVVAQRENGWNSFFGPAEG